MLLAGDIDMGHARALLALDRATQITAASQISARKMSVREAESLVKKLSAEFTLTSTKPKKEKSRDLKRVEDELSDLLAAQVEVRVKKRVKRAGRMEEMGELSIQFGSLDELNGLIDRLRESRAPCVVCLRMYIRHTHRRGPPPVYRTVVAEETAEVDGELSILALVDQVHSKHFTYRGVVLGGTATAFARERAELVHVRRPQLCLRARACYGRTRACVA
jgi:hypothetical protein